MADYGSLNEFVRRFVGPLVMGGRVEVTDLIGPGVIAGWMRPTDLDASLVARVTAVMRTHLAHVGPVGSVDMLPLDAVVLAAAWHNLLAMTHPEARARASLRRKARQWTLALLEWAAPPYTRAEVSLRHAALGRLAALGRVDTHVTFWAGYADFIGVSPPAALVALPKVRRVNESKTRVDLFALLAGLDEGDAATDPAGDLTGVARAALALSPLTDVALADRPHPFAFAWAPPTLNAMADAAIRGGAQRLLLGRGVGAVRAVEQATLALARASMPAAAARLLLRLHLELLCLDALSTRTAQVTEKPAGAQSTGASPTTVSQPLAFDAYVRLGPARVASIVGVGVEALRRVLPIDPNRPVPKDPPSAPLLQRAGALEVRT